MATPKGKEWGGAFVALVVVSYGLLFIDNYKTSAEIYEYFLDIPLAILIAGVATLAWFAWSFLRRYDIPGHQGDEED